MGKISIQDIASSLIEKHGLSKKDAAGFVNAMFDIIQQALERDRLVKVKGLGTFKIIDVDPRESVNVNTGERVLIEGHNKITFTPDQQMKELVNKPFSQFETIVLNDGVDFEETRKDTQSVVSDDVTDSLDVPLVKFVEDGDATEKVVAEPEEIKVEQSRKPDEVRPVETVIDSESVISEEVVADSQVDDEEKEEIQEEEPVLTYAQSSSPDKKWLISAVVSCLIGLIVGYIIGSQFPLSDKTSLGETDDVAAVTPEVKKPVADVVTKPVGKEIQKPDTIKEVKPAADETTSVAQKQESSDGLDQYELKNARVRTGAYRIIGSDYVEKVRPGDNLARISRRTLGPDMECYIEVFNDLTSTSELTVGQDIKIPKLQWKKKKNTQK